MMLKDRKYPEVKVDDAVRVMITQKEEKTTGSFPRLNGVRHTNLHLSKMVFIWLVVVKAKRV